MLRASSAVCLLLVTACSTTKAPTAALNALSTEDRVNETQSAKEALEQDFQRGLELCDAQMSSMREAFGGSGKRELAIASVGIIAGSIVVPTLAAKMAAAKSAIAGWGGLSGAANAAQYTLQQKGVSASRLGRVYENTRQEVRAASEAYAIATKNADRIKAVNKLAIACRYPALPLVEPPTAPASDPGG